MTPVLLPPPERTHDQRLAALELGNRIRTHRAQVKRDLKAGRLSMADVLADPDCSTMKVYDVMLHLPKFGRVKASTGLGRLRISTSKTCGGLTDRQQMALIEALGSGEPVSRWGRIAANNEPAVGGLYTHPSRVGSWRLKSAGRRWVRFESTEITYRNGMLSFREERADWPNGWQRA